MTHVLILPPQQEPKQVTARSRTQTLLEHLQGFLAHHNPSGYVVELPPEELAAGKTIAGMLSRIVSVQQVSVQQLKRDALKIKQLSNKAIKHQPALNLLAQCLGYAHWDDLYHRCGGDTGLAPNRNNELLAKLALFDSKTATSKEIYRHVSSDPTPPVYHRSAQRQRKQQEK